MAEGQLLQGKLFDVQVGGDPSLYQVKNTSLGSDEGFFYFFLFSVMLYLCEEGIVRVPPVPDLYIHVPHEALSGPPLESTSLLFSERGTMRTETVSLYWTSMGEL